MTQDEAEKMIDALLAQESDPKFKAYAASVLASAGPVHPHVGVFWQGKYKGKTPAQVIELCRSAYASGLPAPVAGSTGGGVSSGGLASSPQAFSSTFTTATRVTPGVNGNIFTEEATRRALKEPANPLAFRGRSIAITGNRPDPDSTKPAPSATPAPDPIAIARAESAKLAVQLYPAAADPNSNLTAKIREVAQRPAAESSPILASPSVALLITEMAGKELGIAPQQR